MGFPSNASGFVIFSLAVLTAGGVGLGWTAPATPSATALATILANSSLVNVRRAGVGDLLRRSELGGGDGEGGGGNGRLGGLGGIPPPLSIGGLAGAGGDRAGRRILLSGLGGTFGRVGSVGAV